MSKIALGIELDTETGNIRLRGPLDQPMLCFGLLEMGRLSLTKSTLEDSDGGDGQGGSRIHLPDFIGPLNGRT